MMCKLKRPSRGRGLRERLDWTQAPTIAFCPDERAALAYLPHHIICLYMVALRPRMDFRRFSSG